MSEQTPRADSGQPPPPHPAITRLTWLIDALLADYEATTGRPAPAAEDILAALAAVAEIPEEEQRRHARARHQAQRTAYYRGKAGR